MGVMGTLDRASIYQWLEKVSEESLVSPKARGKLAYRPDSIALVTHHCSYPNFP